MSGRWTACATAPRPRMPSRTRPVSRPVVGWSVIGGSIAAAFVARSAQLVVRGCRRLASRRRCRLHRESGGITPTDVRLDGPDPHARPGGERRASATTGGSAVSSTRSIRARSPTRTTTASGDLPGIIDKLDYLNDGTERSLGIDAIWLSPIHPSPGFDVGYDVADYDAIDPVFGTLDDFDRLVAEAHRRGIRVMLDLVMNHTSSAHRWFEESRQRSERPVRRLLPVARREARPVWQARPTEQLAVVLRRLGLDLGRDPRTVLHAHVPARAARPQLAQPGRSRGDAARWSAAGSTGASTGSGSTSSTRSSSTPSCCRTRVACGAADRYDRQVHLHDKDQPELLDFLAEFRALVDSYPGADDGRRAVLVGPDGRRPAGCAPATWCSTGILIRQPWRAKGFAEASDDARADVRGGRLADDRPVEPRPAAPGESPGTGRGSPRRATRWLARPRVLILTLRGTPFIYYGEEIGARDVAGAVGRDHRPAGHAVAAGWSGGSSRGGTATRPARRCHGAVARTAASRRRRRGSGWRQTPTRGRSRPRTRDPVVRPQRPTAACIWLRRRHPALQVGAYRQLPGRSDDVFAFERATDGETHHRRGELLGDEPQTFRIRTAKRWKTLFDTHAPAQRDVVEGDELTLRPYEAVILRAV